MFAQFFVIYQDIFEKQYLREEILSGKLKIQWD